MYREKQEVLTNRYKEENVTFFFFYTERAKNEAILKQVKLTRKWRERKKHHYHPGVSSNKITL